LVGCGGSGSSTSTGGTSSTQSAAPSIAVQPATQTVTVGQPATFKAAATSGAASSFQWMENGTAIAGATGATYTTPVANSADNGDKYSVVAKVAGASVQSNYATLTVAAPASIKTVFVILMENHNWSAIKGNSAAPYINNTLLHLGAHAEQYYNPPGNHPSLPNYLWLEAGTNFGILNDDAPSADHQSSTMHLVTLLKNANISWKAYEEGIPGTSCPLSDQNLYAVRHDPFVYFDDVTNSQSSTSAYCISHVRPFSEFDGDLQANKVASYNFITPDLCDDMHNCSVASGDSWLAQNLPKILNSAAYQQGGAIFITWDEGSNGDGPIGMIVLSPFAKAGYSNSVYYNHGSTLKTVQEIFQVTPMLGDAGNQTDLSDLFTSFP
jgi:phosphatidylinositol-3-phosphatase